MSPLNLTVVSQLFLWFLLLHSVQSSLVSVHEPEGSSNLPLTHDDLSGFCGSSSLCSSNSTVASKSRLKIHPCMCDTSCIRYNDCCPNVNTSVDPTLGKQEKNHWKCLPTKGTKLLYNQNVLMDSTYLYMVAKCPRRWKGSQTTIQHCEKISEYDKDHVLDIPVLSLESNITYANVHCAICNEESKLAEWTASIACNSNFNSLDSSLSDFFNKATYLPGSLSWMYETNESTGTVTCDLVIEELINLPRYIQSTNARGCVPSIDTCAEYWKNHEDALYCGNYTSLVVDEENQLYKNPHCLRCNGKDTEKMLCTSSLEHSMVPVTRKQLTMNSLFNFQVKEGNIVGFVRQCPQHHFWDEIHQICVSENLNGTVPVANPCLWTNLTKDEVIFIEGNDSIQVKATGKIYTSDQFELVGDYVQVCSGESRKFRSKYTEELNIFSTICLVVSLICLALHILVHLLIPKLRNLPGRNLLSLSVCLFFAQLVYLVMISRTEVYIACFISGVLIHFFYLASFLWMNVMSFDIFQTFRGNSLHKSGGNRQFSYYCLYSYGISLLIVCIGLILDFVPSASYYAPQYGSGICYISNPVGLIEFFIVPVAILLLANTVMYVTTVCSIWQHSKAARTASRRRSRRKDKKNGLAKRGDNVRLVLYIKLALITGVGWSLGFVSELLQSAVLEYLFVFFNGLQGAYIFIAFDLKKKVFRMTLAVLTRKQYDSVHTSGSNRHRSTLTTKTSVAATENRSSTMES